MNDSAHPQFAELLGSCLAQVPNAAIPRFLALLERGAADRYRQWSRDIPEHVEVLMACALREDDIADRVERVWPVADSVLEHMHTLLPQARDLYYGVFVGLSAWDQLSLQADAELQGAAAWRGIASSLSDPTVLAELERCAKLEEESSRELQRIIVRRPSNPG
jgi:hypothetical protein